MIQDVLKIILAGRTLGREEARRAMDRLMAGDATPGQLGAFLAALKVRGEREEELAGFAESLRAHAVRVPIDRAPLLDTCGTGGDGAGTFNISTAAAFIAAGAGAAVAKHGNRSVSSKCGSADVLEALGVKAEVSPELAARCVREAGVCFLFAPAYHPATRHAAVVRKELGCRTVFNLLGPLANPARAGRQLLGVYDRGLVGTLARTLLALGSEEAMVVAADDGLDEISPTAPTRVAHLKGGKVREYEIDPSAAGLEAQPAGSCAGGDAATNARILRGVLDGEEGPARQVCLLNAGASLLVAGIAKDLKDGAERAAASIDTGRARAALDALRELSRGA